jgi:hypothetical protein
LFEALGAGGATTIACLCADSVGFQATKSRSSVIIGLPQMRSGDPPVRKLHIACANRAFLKWSRVDSNFTYLSLIGAAVHLDKAPRGEREETARLVFPQIACRLCPQTHDEVGVLCNKDVATSVLQGAPPFSPP